jgi:hypothetical protein
MKSMDDPDSAIIIHSLNLWSHASPHTRTAQPSIPAEETVYWRYQLTVECSEHDRTECCTTFTLIYRLSCVDRDRVCVLMFVCTYVYMVGYMNCRRFVYVWACLRVFLYVWVCKYVQTFVCVCVSALLPAPPVMHGYKNLKIYFQQNAINGHINTVIVWRKCGGSVGKSYCHVHESQGRVTAGQCSWNCSRRKGVLVKVQRLKTGPIQLRVHTPKKSMQV